MDTRLTNLESKIAFYEDTLDKLNQEVIMLNQIVANQQQQLLLLTEKIKTIEPSYINAGAERPPHY